VIKYLTPHTVLKIIKFWPPLFASGISVESMNDDLTIVTVQMKQYFYNTNYVGSHYGGSIFSMTDPFYMFMLLHHLKEDHVIWDQSASIDFIKPAKGTIRATFTLNQNTIEEIKKKCLERFNYKPEFEVNIYNEENQIVAKVKKTLYVRRKDAKNRFSLPAK
jgi:acyl-coenzyme A thioesterase PaaI-like protein